MPHEALPPLDQCVVLIFGYGSLLWKQNFPFVAAHDAYIKGYRRVFYQGSPDHRGVPGKPGRVVTLLKDSDANSRVYGKAFELPHDVATVTRVLDGLDEREKAGYDRLQVTLYDAHPADGVETRLDVLHHARLQHRHAQANGDKSNNNNNGDANAAAAAAAQPAKQVLCLCYIATEENDDYLGATSMERMATQIVESAGPSGSNYEYLARLADALREMHCDDEHVYALDAAAKRLLATRSSAHAIAATAATTAATTAKQATHNEAISA